MNLFQSGNFVLSSGTKSNFKIDCDGLGWDDIKTLAKMISDLVGPFSSVEGIERGGLHLAEGLQEFVILPAKGGYFPHLIVDDVLTTGTSMQIRRQNYSCGLPVANYNLEDGRRKVIGAVIFARGECPDWVKPLFTLNKLLYS